MPLIPIADEDDPRIGAFRNIRERDLVGRAGHFIAEGKTVLDVLINQSHLKPLALLLAQGRVESLGPLLSRLDPSVPIYVAPQSVLDGIAGFSMHRGVLALGMRPADLDLGALLAGLGAEARLLVLVGIANHDNMGGLFRNAAAFGVDAVLLDSTSCDPLYRKAIRVSAGGVLIVPFARLAEDVDLVALLQAHGFECMALSPAGTDALSALRAKGRLAFFFGAEGSGLPESILSRVQTVRIAMAGHMDSLNVATASGIVLHHFTRGS
jgi:tRNA G18 (ribose-2'-O)-methylase SpoU